MRNETALGLQEARGPWARVLRFILYTGLFVIFAGPLLALMIGAFTPTVNPTQFTLVPDRLSLENLERAIDRNVLHYLLNSFVVVGAGLVLQVLVSVLAGYALARKRFRGSAVVLVVILMTMMLPEEVLAVPLSVLLADLPVLHINLVGSLVGMIVPVAGWGFSILVMTEFMKEIPKELEESAKLDGAGEFRVFWQVVLPLCRPALGVIGIFGFVMIWDQYMLPLLVATDPDQYTLPLALRTLRSDDQVGIGVLLVGAFLAMLPSVLAFLALQRSFIRGLQSGAIKG
ncbi:carbohydrate ABC transporter permease [Streptomyces bicolor]|uniref:carbohydrate ABC transporter permease n=1 Tax=Streptomyces bicolor TaxID=66874 RepID=UPI0004E1875D|nr:carbohydrate ABC transporter permease [Streptomyces bicolor]